MDDATITSLKTAFIRTQVRRLETPLETPDLPPSTTTTPPLSAKVQADLVTKVNDKIRQHNRLIFSTQSQRQIAEQIESLHWNLVEADLDRAKVDTLAVRRDAELTEPSTIRGLPETMEELGLHPDFEAGEDEQNRYTILRAELASLSEEREALRKKLAQYRKLRDLMAPLQQPLEQVQPNLVTRDGELGQELERTKVLLARIAGQVGELRKADAEPVPTSQAAVRTNQEKLARAMEMG
jgi:uncharacterized coiled-coil DUF342 family protein